MTTTGTPEKATASVIFRPTVVLRLNTSYRDPSASQDPTSQYIVSTFLILLFIISFTANLFLLVTLSSSYSLKRVAFNWLLLNLSVVCLTECVFDIVIAIYYVAVDAWKLGRTVCSLNAFTTELVTLQTTLGVCTLCLERLAASWRPEQFKRLLTIGKQTVAIAILWLAGCLLCVPVLARTIESRLFPARYGCSVAGNDGDTYSALITAWCYVLPLLLILCYLCYTSYSIYKDKKASRNKKQEINYAELFFQESYHWSEWASHTLLITIAVLYMLLHLPYIVVQQASAVCACYDPPTKSSNSTMPDVERTSKLDTTFTWFRYLYACFYPISVFWLRKDIRKKFIVVFGCCRSNAVDDMSPRPMRPERRREKRREAQLAKHSSSTVNIATPVLFATEDGLHLRVLDLGACLNLNPKTNVQDPTMRPKFVSYLCDVDSGAADEQEPIMCLDEEMDSGVSGCSNESTVSTISDLYVGSKTSAPLPSSPKVIEEEEQEITAPKQDSPKTSPKTKKCVRFNEMVTVYRPISASYSEAEVEMTAKTAPPSGWVRATPVDPRHVRSRIPISEQYVKSANPDKTEPSLMRVRTVHTEGSQKPKYRRPPL